MEEYDKAVDIDQQVIRYLDNGEMCNVYRNELIKDKKCRSFGLLATFLSCNDVIGFVKSIKSEGCRRVTVKYRSHCLYLKKYRKLHR